MVHAVRYPVPCNAQTNYNFLMFCTTTVVQIVIPEERSVGRAMAKPKISLQLGLMTTIVICWLVPILIIVTLGGMLFGDNYRRSVRQEIDASADYALRQVHQQLKDAIRDSKTISYDGIVRSAYRTYQQNGDSASLYRSISDYLSLSFSRAESYKAVFISFWDKTVDVDVYLLSSGTAGYEFLQACRDCEPFVLQRMADADTDICFLLLEGNLYMARNLLDSHFEPYASVVMVLEPSVVFQPLHSVPRIHDLRLEIDDTVFCMDEGNSLVPAQSGQEDIRYEAEADGHRFAFTAELEKYDLWGENPWLSRAACAVALMVLPLLVVVIALFRHHVSQPMQTLVSANLLVQSGQRGCQIDRRPPNREFEKLYSHFNAMSAELKCQFDRSYQEQQAAQRAQIKALQSQINPHFLNNTLEIINWEARIAENDRVSAMIEALSTMLGAALDRDGRTQITLKEELGYVEAYLYIIRERLGEGFRVHQQIDQSLLERLIPRLILQPIVENAVEHDITTRRGGSLWVRAYRQEERMVLEVEHDGQMTEEDRQNIRRLLSGEAEDGGQVGLRNVHQRLKLIYGPEGTLSVEQTPEGTILARISFPMAVRGGGKQ